MRIKEQIFGKEVINSSGMIVGKVKDIEVNWNDNEIEAIVIGNGGISESLGLSKEENVIPYDMVKQIGDKILLKENKDESGLESIEMI
ncbi:MAG: PRC-barrel domain-containing protein [Methanobacterium sp.]